MTDAPWAYMTLRALSTLGLLALLIGPAACSADAAEDGSESEGDEAAIIGGRTSGSTDNAVVSIFRRGQLHCTGTLIGRNVVATALSCVADRDEAAQTGSPMMGERIRPSELTVRAGQKPSKTSATISRIVVTDPQRMEQGSIAIQSNNLALLYVQPVDPTFNQIQPKRIAQRSVDRDATITVVGYGGSSESTRTTQPERLKKDVKVLLGVKDRGQSAQADLGTRTVDYTNKPREFVTGTVACGGDAGGPAFDTTGNLVGIVSAVVGQCVEGSLSVFTDVPSHLEFLQKAITESRNIGCLSDDQCGGATSGKICDAKTNKCISGCRAGGTSCQGGAQCSVQGRTTGAVGICRTTSSTQDSSDPFYDQGPYVTPDIPGITCPGNPLCPSTAPARECRTDTECNGVNGSKPRVCDIPLGRCLDGCRIGTAGMCAQGQACGAYEDDPAIGICQLAKPPAPPPGPPASPPVVNPEPPAPAPAATTEPTPTTTKKKATNKAKDDGGCSIGSAAPSSVNSVWLALAPLAFLARRRRRG